jgi:hypothetical protein
VRLIDRMRHSQRGGPMLRSMGTSIGTQLTASAPLGSSAMQTATPTKESGFAPDLALAVGRHDLEPYGSRHFAIARSLCHPAGRVPMLRPADGRSWITLMSSVDQAGNRIPENSAHAPSNVS